MPRDGEWHYSYARKPVFIQDGTTATGTVMFEHTQGRGWKSVIVDGRFEELPDQIGHKLQRDHAWSVLSKHADWWEPGALKPVIPPASHSLPHVFFRILVEEMSGREASE